MAHDLRAPRSVEQLATDCRDKLDNDAEERPPKTIDIMPMTEVFLDIAERILLIEKAIGLRETNGEV